MSQWDSKTGQQGLAAWRADRADLRAAIDRAGEVTPSRVVGDTSPVWQPRCRCGEPAERTLVLVWENIEGRRINACARHYGAMLDIIHNIRESAPDAVADLRVLVAG